MSRAPDPLEQTRDRPCRTHLTDEVHAADVDAELERGRRDEGAKLARLQSLLGAEPLFARETAVVRSDLIGTE